jgi:putative tryptophan/tyrosine transport system substrate-binding protein
MISLPCAGRGRLRVIIGRREFFATIGGAAAWPLAAGAQQGSVVRRVGVLSQSLGWAGSFEALTDTLRRLGWSEGSNIHFERRSSETDPIKMRVLAAELVGLKPDVILAVTTIAAQELQRLTNAIPIIFVSVTDPVSSGLVRSISSPGGNITGFSNAEPTIGGKHIEIFKEIAPEMTAVVCIFNPETDPAFRSSSYPVLEAAARHHAIEISAAPVGNEADIERVIATLGDKQTTGLFIAGEPFMVVRLPFITSLTTRHRVISVCAFRYFVERGCLISYGIELLDEFRQAAGYIDRILKGASPADLPVQGPTRFELAVNLKIAKVIGVTISPLLLAKSDFVVE